MSLYSRVLFIVLIIALSYLLKKGNVFKEEDSQTFVNYVMYFALPLTIIKNFSSLDFQQNLVYIPLLAWFSILLGLTISYVVGKLLSLPAKSMKTFLLISSFGNTAFLGYPFSYAILGREGLTYAIIFDQLGSFLFVITLGLLIAVGSFKIRELLTFPPFLALCLSLLLHHKQLPDSINYFLQVSSASLIPVILFSLGLRFEPIYTFSPIKPLVFALLIKMFLVPCGVLALLKTLSLEGTVYKTVLLESCMPPMVLAGVLALKYNLDFRLAFSAITLGIPLSFITVPIFTQLL